MNHIEIQTFIKECEERIEKAPDLSRLDLPQALAIIKDLLTAKEILNDITKRVVPGIIDSGDAWYSMVKELKEKLKVAMETLHSLHFYYYCTACDDNRIERDQGLETITAILSSSESGEK